VIITRQAADTVEEFFGLPPGGASGSGDRDRVARGDVATIMVLVVTIMRRWQRGPGKESEASGCRAREVALAAEALGIPDNPGRVEHVRGCIRRLSRMEWRRKRLGPRDSDGEDPPLAPAAKRQRRSEDASAASLSAVTVHPSPSL